MLIKNKQIKFKTCLKMCIQRLRYAQEKQQALAKQQRREVAQLLLSGKEQKAHYRVESLINCDIHIELLEILELYCELLLARVSVLSSNENEADLIANHVDDGINEAVRALVYSALYASEIKELGQLKELLTLKFGLEFLKGIVDEKIGVPEKVLKKCSPGLPSSELVVLYLSEIARTYDVPYSQLASDEESGSEGGIDSDDNATKDTDDDNDGGAKEHASELKPFVVADNDVKLNEDEESPIVVRSPRRNTETVGHNIKIPSDIKKDVKVVHEKMGGVKHKTERTVKNKEQDSELEELKKRFEALRR